MAYNREKIQAELFELQDEKYRDFHSKLIPDIAEEKYHRNPYACGFSKYSKTICKDEDAPLFYKTFRIHIMRKIICI